MLGYPALVENKQTKKTQETGTSKSTADKLRKISLRRTGNSKLVVEMMKWSTDLFEETCSGQGQLEQDTAWPSTVLLP